MTKLKTLKDLRRIVYGSNSGEVLDFVREEAIKWVKYLKEREIDNRFGHKKRDERITFQISILIEFFNITEDEITG